MNKKYLKLQCINCHKEWKTGDYFLGCPDCFQKGNPSALICINELKWEISEHAKGMKRYAKMLPYEDFVSLGEGQTPLVQLKKIEKKFGVKHIFSKNEFQNPTGSHKDRMNPFIIQRALETKSKVIAAASSGNEGASLACYAAAADLPCAITATDNIAKQWKDAIINAGAELIITETHEMRGKYIMDKIETDLWYSATNLLDPPVGSSCYGIEGYKTIAYELYEDMKSDCMPDYIFVPVSRGDLLWGVYKGFEELKALEFIQKIPKLIAVEPITRLEYVKSIEDCTRTYQGDTSLTPSIGGGTVTVQSKLALEKSNGFAISVSQDEVEPSVREFGEQGLYLERSSAVTLACLKKALNTNQIKKDSTVVIIATSHGYKNEN